MFRILALLFIAIALVACEENLENAEFNAYFFYPDDQNEYLGLVQGLSACQSAASAKAHSLRMSSSSGWSYICCKKTSKSSCATKHK